MRKIINWLITIYQKTHILSHCRFIPTCSEYTRQAIEHYGISKGLFLGIKRILRCHPLGGWGYDPLNSGDFEKNG